jgi:RNA polymerase sigma factor (sigma-70 family)
MQQFDERELVLGCVNNERVWQERLYRKYFGTMNSMCLKYTNGNKDIALEILNNGFLRVFQKLHTFSFAGSLEGWIRRLVYHSISDYYKANARYAAALLLEDHDQPTHDNTLNNLYVEDIQTLIKKLPPATQKVFNRYALEGYSHAEIAAEFNISEGTSKWHISSARETLKKLIYQSA